MAETADLIVRGGSIVDGSGAEPFEADVVISSGKIAAIEARSTLPRQGGDRC